MAIKDYDEAKARVVDFIKTFYVSDSQGVKEYVYSDQVASISRRRQVAIYIKLDHVVQHDADLATEIENNTVRYQKIFANVIDEYVKELLGDNPVSQIFY
jgi:DNA replication licensing factor MCM7